MSEPKRRALGRGLSALITNTEAAPPDSETGAVTGSQSESTGVRTVPVRAIEPNPRQPRSHFDEAALNELADSIRVHGVIQPLVLTTNPRRPDLYYIIAGERRWRAAQRAGLEAVPAVIRDAGDQQMVELALIENVQRDDLDALEEALAYASLLNEFGMTQAEVAQRVGKSRSAVANSVRLLQLPPIVQAALVDESITAGHARALLALPEPASMTNALNEILTRELNVRQTEALVKRLIEQPTPPPAPKPEPDPQIRTQVARMEEGFRRALGTRVSLDRNGDGSGRLVIHFYSDGDLETLYRTFASDDEEGDDDFGIGNSGLPL